MYISFLILAQGVQPLILYNYLLSHEQQYSMEVMQLHSTRPCRFVGESEVGSFSLASASSSKSTARPHELHPGAQDLNPSAMKLSLVNYSWCYLTIQSSSSLSFGQLGAIAHSHRLQHFEFIFILLYFQFTSLKIENFEILGSARPLTEHVTEKV